MPLRRREPIRDNDYESENILSVLKLDSSLSENQKLKIDILQNEFKSLKLKINDLTSERDKYKISLEKAHKNPEIYENSIF